MSKVPSSKAGVHVGHLLRWFFVKARDLPWRRTLDPYAIWISEIMLQQTQVKTVIPYYERWLRELPDVQTLAAAPQERVLKLWEGLGYYTRARNLQKAAQQIAQQHRGEFPCDFEAILELPGIGRYTAGAISSITFNQPRPILDGNVVRVLTRLFDIRKNPRDKQTNEKLWQLAETLVQASSRLSLSKFKTQNPKLLLSGPCSALNQSLMELGATVCTPAKPACPDCPLRQHCQAHALGLVDALPNLDKRTTATQRKFFAYVLEHRGRILVRQRPAGVVNAHLWEFPNVEIATNNGSDPTTILADELKLKAKSLAPLVTVRHSITRYRITVEAHAGKLSSTAPRTGQWFTVPELDKLAFASAHRRILERLQNVQE